MTVLTLNHKDVKKVLKSIKHNRTHKKALRQNGCFYCLLNNQKYYVEDIQILRKLHNQYK